MATTVTKYNYETPDGVKDLGDLLRNRRIKAKHLRVLHENANYIYVQRTSFGQGHLWGADGTGFFQRADASYGTVNNNTGTGIDLDEYVDFLYIDKLRDSDTYGVTFHAYGCWMTVEATYEHIGTGVTLTDTLTLTAANDPAWGRADAAVTRPGLYKVTYRAKSDQTPDPEDGRDKLFAILPAWMVLTDTELPTENWLEPYGAFDEGFDWGFRVAGHSQGPIAELGPKMWLDPKIGLSYTNGDNITDWNALCGADWTTTVSGTNWPHFSDSALTNSAAAVVNRTSQVGLAQAADSDGGGSAMLNGSTGFTIVSHFKTSANWDNVAIIESEDSVELRVVNNPGIQLTMWDTDGTVHSVRATEAHSTVELVAIAWWDGPTNGLKIRIIKASSDNTYTGSATVAGDKVRDATHAWTIGSDDDGNAAIGADIGEQIVFDYALSSTQRDQVVDYFKARLGWS